MAKPNKQTPTPSTSTQAPTAETATQEPMPAETTASTTESTLAKTDVVQAEIIETPEPDDDDSLGYLAGDLPHLASKLKTIKRVSPEALDEAMEKLTADERKKFDALMDRMAGSDDTSGEGGNADFMSKIPKVKLYQQGDPAGRPTGVPAGTIYIEHGQALCTLPDQAEMSGLPSSFTGALIGHFYGRIFWPGEDKVTKERLYPADYPTDRKGPICQSLDRTQGVFYSACSKCPFNPNKTRGDDMGCKDEVTLFIMLPDFSVVQAVLSGTSARMAEALEKKTGQWARRYVHFLKFSVGSKKSADGKNTWKAWEADVQRTPEHRNGVPTSDGFRAVAHVFATKIRTEWYYPQLANLYSQGAREAENRVSGAPAEKAAGGESDAAKAMREARTASEANNM